MTVEKIKSIIDEMVDGRLAALKELSDNKGVPENHEIIRTLCVEGKILLKLRERISDEELEELSK